ncbi:hypothetical protein SLS60_004997 [Paraconiothyrium brasiliense]|uniref:Uncharacterized protein n=1 Tax=Paraconiothyrium brasiliense TaxID=300254 RepID=A0ABR3RM13_9PLEO
MTFKPRMQMMSMSIEHDKAVRGSIYFLNLDDRYKKEKPYAFRYPVRGVEQTNMRMTPTEGIRIKDIRGRENDFTFDKDGFTVANVDHGVSYSDFFTEQGLKSYFKVMECMLQSLLGAEKVHIFRHGIRKRHVEFPVSTGQPYEYDQPTSVAHIDTTPKEAQMEIRRQYGADAEQYLSKSRYQWIK